MPEEFWVPSNGEPVESASEDRLDGYGRRGCRERAPAGSGLNSFGPEGVGEPQDALGAAQSFDDAVGEHLLDQGTTGRADALRLLEAPMTVALEERPSVGVASDQGWYGDRRVGRNADGCNQSVVLEDRDHLIGRTHPQRLTHQGMRCRVQDVLELDVAIAGAG